MYVISTHAACVQAHATAPWPGKKEPSFNTLESMLGGDVYAMHTSTQTATFTCHPSTIFAHCPVQLTATKPIRQCCTNQGVSVHCGTNKKPVLPAQMVSDGRLCVSHASIQTQCNTPTTAKQYASQPEKQHRNMSAVKCCTAHPSLNNDPSSALQTCTGCIPTCGRQTCCLRCLFQGTWQPKHPRSSLNPRSSLKATVHS
jgi:hypothetical protein